MGGQKQVQVLWGSERAFDLGSSEPLHLIFQPSERNTVENNQTQEERDTSGNNRQWAPTCLHLR